MKRKLVVLLFLALMIRQFFVSGIFFPIRIQSGSMFPAFRGPTFRLRCKECQHHFEIGVDREKNDRSLWTCPYCSFMENTLDDAEFLPGERIYLNRFALFRSERQRFDPMVFRNSQQPTQWVLKRIAGLPGESISFRNGNLYLDGQIYRKSLSEQEKFIVPYIFGSWRCDLTQQKVSFRFDPREPAPHFRPLHTAVEASTQESRFSFFSIRNPYNPSYRQEGFLENENSMAPNIKTDEVLLRFPYRYLDAEIIIWSKSGKFKIEKNEISKGIVHFSIQYNGKTRTVMFRQSTDTENLTARISLIDETFRFAVAEETLIEFPLQIFPMEEHPASGESVISFVFSENITQKIFIHHVDSSEFGKNIQIFIDPYIASGGESWTVPPRHYFVLGDNAAISRDSRSWNDPFVAKESLLGIPFPVKRKSLQQP